MPHEICSFGNGAAIGRSGTPRRIVGFEVWSDAGKVLERVEVVSIVEGWGDCKSQRR
jgi:hypothetical protein